MRFTFLVFFVSVFSLSALAKNLNIECGNASTVDEVLTCVDTQDVLTEHCKDSLKNIHQIRKNQIVDRNPIEIEDSRKAVEAAVSACGTVGDVIRGLKFQVGQESVNISDCGHNHIRCGYNSCCTH